VRGQVGGMIERVRCRGEKRLLPLPLHVKGKKKHSTVQNDNVSCFFFFFLIYLLLLLLLLLLFVFSLFLCGRSKMSYNNNNEWTLSEDLTTANS
jgi:hypothetical protein